jgi:hypothetical protein
LYKEITGDTYPVEKIGKLAELEVNNV